MDIYSFHLDFAALPHSLWNVSQHAATAFASGLWQGVIIAACLAICLMLAPRTSASLRFSLWMAGFVTLVALPLLSFVPNFPALASPGSGASGSHLATGPAHPWLMLDTRWSLAIVGLWLAASLYRAADLVVHILHLRGIWLQAVPVASTTSNSLLRDTSRNLELCTTRELERPSVIGFFAPRILIPEWLMERLTPSELDQIVLHESEHLRRRDDWTNLVQKLVLVLFPLNPALLWIERRLCKEREMACDEGVVRRTHAPRAYAACLATLAERGLEHRSQGISAAALSLGAWHRRPELVHRVHSILVQGKQLSPWATRSLMTAMGCSLIFGSVALSRSPQVVGFASLQPAMTAAATIHTGFAKPASQPVSASVEPAPKAIAVAAPIKPIARRNASRIPAAEHSFTDAPQNAWIQSVELVSSNDHSQHWIMLTTWQAPSMDQNQLTSDFAAQENEQPATGTAVRQPVVPKSFAFPALAAVPTRNGWFIIQL